jgi:hypothetical protein
MKWDHVKWAIFLKYVFFSLLINMCKQSVFEKINVSFKTADIIDTLKVINI